MEKLLDEQDMIYRDIFSYIEYTEWRLTRGAWPP